MGNCIIKTNSGKIQGYEKDGVVRYLGIPYAQPPVGDLRLRRARPVQPWSGILDAREYGPPSVQYFMEEEKGDENCLTLNIRTPSEGENLPVLVYIHGGGYNTGAASDPLYAGESFVANGIVYVTFQYRLNVWGFYDFSTYPGCGDFDTNCGLSDHLVAMQWIHDNIRCFSGDPDRVTIAGESAGATSVLTLMAAPAFKGLFQRAIVSSALPNAVASHEVSRKNVDLFIKGMGWTSDDLPRLKNISACDALSANEYMAAYHQYENPGIFLPSIVVDDLCPQRLIEAIADGNARDVKLMIGCNLHEGTMFVRNENTNFPNSWEMIRQMFEFNGYGAQFESVKAYYEAGSKDSINGIDEAFINFATDYGFLMPALKIAQAQKAYNDVWMYRFEYVNDFAKQVGLLAGHAMDLPFDFNSFDFGIAKEMAENEKPAIIEKLADEIHMSWVRFIKEGVPDRGHWPKYKGYKSPVRIFDTDSRTEERDYTELMELWGDMRFYED